VLLKALNLSGHQVAERVRGLNPELASTSIGSFVLGKLLYQLIPILLIWALKVDAVQQIFTGIIQKGIGMSKTAHCPAINRSVWQRQVENNFIQNYQRPQQQKGE